MALWLLARVLSRRLATRDNRFQKDEPLVSTNGTQIHVIITTDNEDPLAGVTPRVRVVKNIEQVATLDMKNDVFESDASLGLELVVLRLVPREVLHLSSL